MTTLYIACLRRHEAFQPPAELVIGYYTTLQRAQKVALEAEIRSNLVLLPNDKETFRRLGREYEELIFVQAAGEDAWSQLPVLRCKMFGEDADHLWVADVRTEQLDPDTTKAMLRIDDRYMARSMKQNW